MMKKTNVIKNSEKIKCSYAMFFEQNFSHFSSRYSVISPSFDQSRSVLETFLPTLIQCLLYRNSML